MGAEEFFSVGFYETALHKESPAFHCESARFWSFLSLRFPLPLPTPHTTYLDKLSASNQHPGCGRAKGMLIFTPSFFCLSSYCFLHMLLSYNFPTLGPSTTTQLTAGHRSYREHSHKTCFNASKYLKYYPLLVKQIFLCPKNTVCYWWGVAETFYWLHVNLLLLLTCLPLS